MKAFLGNLCAVVALTVCGITSSASSLKSDLLLYVPKQIIKAAAPGFEGSFTYQAGNITVPAEFPIMLQNVNVTFNYKVKSITPNAGGTFDAVFSIDTAKATMAELHIDSFVDRVINGQPVRIHLKADCQNLAVDGNSGFSATGAGRIANGPLTVVMDDMSWTTNTVWALQAAACQGPTGIVPFLQDEINKMWLNPTNLKGMVLGELNTRITAWLNDRSSWAQNFTGVNATMFAKAQEFIETPGSWVFRMAADFQTVKDCPIFTQTGSTPPQSATAQPSEIEMHVSGKLPALWGQCIQEMGMLNRKDHTKDIPAFAQLMSSGVAKQTVWPDLLRYPDTAQFMFYTITNGMMRFEPRTVATPAANTLYFNMGTTLVSTMRYIKNGVEEPYMTWASPLRGGVHINAKGGAYNKPTTFSLMWTEDPQTKLNYRFDVPRSVVTNPNIDLTYLEPELVKVVKSKTFAYDMPPLPITDDHQIVVTGLKRGSDVLQMIFAITKKN